MAKEVKEIGEAPMTLLPKITKDLQNMVMLNESISEVYFHADGSYNIRKEDIGGKSYTRTLDALDPLKGGIAGAKKTKVGVPKFEVKQTVSRETILSAQAV